MLNTVGLSVCKKKVFWAFKCICNANAFIELCANIKMILQSDKYNNGESGCKYKEHAKFVNKLQKQKT